MNLLRGWLFYIVLSFSILVLAVCVLCTTPFASVKWRYEAICRPWAKFVLALLRVICGIRLEMKGMENLPPADTQAVVLMKHQSAWDPFWLGAYLPAAAYAGAPAQWKQIDIDSGNTALEQAYEGNPISSCGDNATWSIDNAGTLTIRGTGEITDTPWSDPMILPYSVHIKNVVLEDGITGICSYAFDYTDIVSVTLPATLTHIDYSAFDGCSDLTTVNYAGSPEQWNNIKIANHNDELLNATRHYYSSNASTVSSEENSIFPSTATGNDHSFAASFSDLTPGVSYAVIVSRSEIDPLAPENLIYINQFRATSSGYQQSFQTPRSSALNADDMTYVIASGIYSFDEAPTPTPTPGGSSSSGSGGGGGGGGGAGAAYPGKFRAGPI